MSEKLSVTEIQKTLAFSDKVIGIVGKEDEQLLRDSSPPASQTYRVSKQNFALDMGSPSVWAVGLVIPTG